MDTAIYKMPSPPRTYRTNRITPRFEDLGNGETIIHITQKSGRKHQFTVDTRLFDAFLNNDFWSFCASPMSAKKPEGKYYCKISGGGVSMYLHQFITGYLLTAEKPQIHHKDSDCTRNLQDNLEAVSCKQNLAARVMPPKPKK